MFEVIMAVIKGELMWTHCLGLGDTMECSSLSFSSRDASSGMSSIMGLRLNGGATLDLSKALDLSKNSTRAQRMPRKRTM